MEELPKIRNFNNYVNNQFHKHGMCWQLVFNANFRNWIYIGYAVKVAQDAGYPYILWNDWVYKITDDGWEETDFTIYDLK